jgi:hypothetical protein
VHTRSTVLGSRVVHGPVALLIGERISAERPAPRPYRRMPDSGEAGRDGLSVP